MHRSALRASLLAAALLAVLAPAQESAPPPASSPPPDPAGPTLLVLNKSAATVSLTDPATGEVRATAAVGEGPHEAACSPDGTIAVVCNYGDRVPGSTLSVIDVVEGKTVRTIELTHHAMNEATGAPDSKTYHRPHGIQFLPDGERIVVTAEVERRLLIVDVHKGEIRAAIDTAQGISHMVALSRDFARAFVANIRSGSVSVIDLEQQALLEVIPTGDGAEGIAVHPTRDEVWVTNRAADTVSVIDAQELEVVATIECGEFPIRVAFTRDGSKALVSCARSGEVVLIDVASRKIDRRVDMAEKPVEDAAGGRLFSGTFGESPVPVGILCEPGGKLAFVANTQADIVTVLDLEKGRIARRLKTGREPDGMAWSALAPRRPAEASVRRDGK